MLYIRNALNKTYMDHFERFDTRFPTKFELLTIGERINSFALGVLSVLGAILSLGDETWVACSKELIAQVWTGKIYTGRKNEIHNLKVEVQAMRNDIKALTALITELKDLIAVK